MDSTVGSNSGSNSGNNAANNAGNKPGNKADANGGDNAARRQANHANQAKSSAADARDKLMDDMKAVINDAEAWLKDSTAHEAEDLIAIRKNFETTLQATKTDLLKLQNDMLAKTRLAAQAADTYVRTNPWAAVGVGAAVGLLFGLMASRK